VLSGSENDPDGGERKGGGKGLGALLAKRASPVSNLKGGWRVCRTGLSVSTEVEYVNSGRHLEELWLRDRRG
jgi:hypothetical protein